jgi:hypothetical protein
MPHSRYLMRDLNRSKIDQIMRFNVAQGSERPKSVFEFAVFLILLASYLGALSLGS